VSSFKGHFRREKQKDWLKKKSEKMSKIWRTLESGKMNDVM
jgi:hypothetical protein